MPGKTGTLSGPCRNLVVGKLEACRDLVIGPCHATLLEPVGTLSPNRRESLKPCRSRHCKQFRSLSAEAFGGVRFGGTFLELIVGPLQSTRPKVSWTQCPPHSTSDWKCSAAWPSSTPSGGVLRPTTSGSRCRYGSRISGAASASAFSFSMIVTKGAVMSVSNTRVTFDVARTADTAARGVWLFGGHNCWSRRFPLKLSRQYHWNLTHLKAPALTAPPSGRCWSAATKFGSTEALQRHHQRRTVLERISAAFRF